MVDPFSQAYFDTNINNENRIQINAVSDTVPSIISKTDMNALRDINESPGKPDPIQNQQLDDR